MKTRLNLAISASVREKMEELRIQTGAESLTEVVRRSIDVFEMIIKEQAEGNHIQIQRKDKPPIEIKVI